MEPEYWVDEFRPFGRSRPITMITERDEALLTGEPAPLTVLVDVHLEHEHSPDDELIGPQIPPPKQLYASNWYDGMISAMVEVDGEKMWAKMAQWCFDEQCGWYRRYQVLRLEPSILAHEEACHKSFVDDGWGMFFQKYPDYEEPSGTPVCWFEQ